MILTFKVNIEIFNQDKDVAVKYVKNEAVAWFERILGPTKVYFEGEDKVQAWGAEVEKQDYYAGKMEF